MKKLLPLLLLIFSCDEENLNSSGLGSDGTATQDTTIIQITQDTTIIVLDTIIYNYPPSVVITYPLPGQLDSTTTIKVDVVDDTGISNVKFLIDGVLEFTDSLPPYEYEWDICSHTQTYPYSVLAKAEDIDGNESQSELVDYFLNGHYDCKDTCGGDAVIDSDDTCCYTSEQDECGVCNGDGLFGDYYDCGDMAALIDWGICDSREYCIGNNIVSWTLGRVTKLYNPSIQIPNNAGNLSALEELTITIVADGECPENIGKLTNLKYLQLQNTYGLGDAGLINLPQSIGNLTQLTQLNLPYNKLTTLPDSMVNLINLQTLSVHNNHLIYIPSAMCNIPSLQINASSNCFPNTYTTNDYPCISGIGYNASDCP